MIILLLLSAKILTVGIFMISYSLDSGNSNLYAHQFIRSFYTPIVILSIVGIVTCIGILRLKPWSRISAIIISLLISLFGVINIGGEVNILYLFMILYGVFGLFYLNKTSIKIQFKKNAA